MLCKDFLKLQIVFLFCLFLTVKNNKSRTFIFYFRKFIYESLNLFKPTITILQQNYLRTQQKNL